MLVLLVAKNAFAGFFPLLGKAFHGGVKSDGEVAGKSLDIRLCHNYTAVGAAISRAFAAVIKTRHELYFHRK